jgi:hypothetical protein
MLSSEDLEKILETTTEFTPQQKEEILVQITQTKKREFERRKEELKQIWEKEKAILDAMKADPNKKAELVKDQMKEVKSAYDLFQHYTMTEALAVPDSIYELLETDKCVRRQKIWLMWYCHNGGNAVTACEHAGVTYRRYKTWCTALEFERNRAFLNAKNDIDAAQLDIAEMKLKEMAHCKHSAALIFFLRSRHESYKTAAKQEGDTKKEEVKQGKDWSKEGSEKKAHALMKVLDTI